MATRAISSASTPSAASPTTVNPGIDWSRLRMPCRTMGWSSAITTVVGRDRCSLMGPRSGCGYPELIAQQRHLPTTNLSCPGQTAQALLSRTAEDNGCFDLRDEARDAGITVLHANYRGTQVAAAVMRRAEQPHTSAVKHPGDS